MNRINFAFTLGIMLATATSHAAVPAGDLFAQNCLACHQVENKHTPVVGPSLVEINHIYKNDLKGFIKWCNSPGKKRKDAIQMPSMAHVGDEGLTEIYKWMQEVTKGKKFQPDAPQKEAPVWERLKDSDKPRMHRIFLPYTSPASMAVTIDGKHSFCWDTVSCRMRYIWKGGYIDGNPYWKGNGNRLANLMGVIYYRAPDGGKSGFKLGSQELAPRFKGYKLIKGLPQFHYSLGDVSVSESYTNQKGDLHIDIKMHGLRGEVRYPLGDLSKTNLTYSAGKLVDSALVLTKDEAASFQLVFKSK